MRVVYRPLHLEEWCGDDLKVTEPSAESYSWSAHPARERRGSAIISILVIAGLAYAAGRCGQHPGWSLLALLALVLALNRFFFPSHFTIDQGGITARYPLRRSRVEWRQLRRFVHDTRGGYLSTHATPSRLDPYRGLHLLFGNRRAGVIERIRTSMQALTIEPTEETGEATPCNG